MLEAREVHATLGRHQLVDGFPMVLDLDRSHGVWLHDGVTGREYLDAFTCFASWPVGFNHPMMADAGFRATLERAALCNPANSDLYTREQADFVHHFATHVTPEGFPHHFWVAGGALAVENALKTAFDWKARKLGRTSYEADCSDLSVLHFRQAFHGRSGYTLSLTNTVPAKTGLFPRFPWPRVHNPVIEFALDGSVANDVAAEEAMSCAEIEAALASGTVAAILIEPIQGEGGDNHFRTEFLQKLRGYADAHEALLVYDEVQTGFFGSGRPWMWQHHGVAPDIVAFGKKTQVCGIYAGARVDEVEDNVFAVSSRINSTWGGNLVDMVRCRRFIDIVEAEGLTERTAAVGERIVAGLRGIAKETGRITNVRGKGSLIAFTLPSPDERQALMGRLMNEGVLSLASGASSIRFRLPLILAEDEADELLTRTAAAVG